MAHIPTIKSWPIYAEITSGEMHITHSQITLYQDGKDRPRRINHSQRSYYIWEAIILFF